MTRLFRGAGRAKLATLAAVGVLTCAGGLAAPGVTQAQVTPIRHVVVIFLENHSFDNLFAGVRRHQLNGLVWFDMHQHGGINHQDWRLEDNPAALAAFRREARSFGRPLPR